MYKNKKEIIIHYKQSIAWVESLRNWPEEKWRTQIDEGKWTVAEVIGHLIPWDEFVLHQRIPYLFTKEAISISPDAEIVNQHAAKVSRSRLKDETIHLYIANRKRLISALNDLPDECWTRDLSIRGNSMPLIQYFAGLIEHDLHHFRQIQTVWRFGMGAH